MTQLCPQLGEESPHPEASCLREDFVLIWETTFSTSVTFCCGVMLTSSIFQWGTEFIYSLSVYLFTHSTIFVKHMLAFIANTDKHSA